MQQQAGGSVHRIQFRLGKELHNHPSRTGLYAICKKSSGWPLRITLFRELAELWQHPSRTIHECFLLGAA